MKFKGLTKLMFKIPWEDREIFTALEIETGFVKLSQAKDFSGRRKIIKLKIKEISAQSEKNVVDALKGIFSELKGKVGHLTVCIPRLKVTVRFLRFPTVNEKEIAGMIKLQSVKELPYSKEEIISDYVITEQTKDGYANVALVIVHRDAINAYLNIFKKANLEPERITFSTEAILDWCKIAFRQEKSKECLILIDLDSDNTDIVIVYNSHLVFTRGLNFGIANLPAADLKDKLAEEIERTMEGCIRKTKHKKFERIIFVGLPNETIMDLKPFLEQRFGLPCVRINPFKNINYGKEISLGQYKSEISLLRVLGALLDAQGRKLNLLPEDLREKHKSKSRKEKATKIIALLLGIVILAVFVFARKIHEKQLRISYLDREIKKTASLARKAEAMLEKIKLIESRCQMEGSFVDVLPQLHSLAPEGILFSNFSYDEESKMVSLQGVSRSMSEIFNFMNILEKSVYFKNVQLKYVSKEKARKDASSQPLQPKDAFTEFKIECSLEK